MRAYLIITLTLFLSILSFGQDKSVNEVEIPPPNNEVFAKTSGLISSGRMLGTRPNGGSVDFNHPKTEVMNIYDKDGQLWYQFSIWENSPLFIDKNKKKEFLPFTSWDSVVWEFWLRLVAESSHWYEVEINEETRETRYILKQDQAFARTDFRQYIGPEKAANLVRIDTDSNPLLDAPNGKKIDTYFSKELDRFYVVWKVKGDWIQVAIVDDSKVKTSWTNGWVRWRAGRKMLVGSLLNRWKI